jgi:hypothetical protein
MGGTSSSTQNTQQAQTTNPWQPTIGPLNNLLGSVTGLFPQAQPNAAATQGFGTLASNAANTPNYTPQANAYTQNLIAGGGGPNPNDVSQNLATYRDQMAPYTNANYLDPTQSPGMQSLLEQIRGDVGNSVNSMFAGAGRDLSGLHTQNLARGMSQGLAAPLLNQYNQNVAAQQGAMGNLYNAGNTTTGLLSGLNQTSLGNQAQGYNFATTAAPQVQDLGANRAISASQAPLQYGANNLGLLEGLLLPIAGMGGQTTGNSSTQGTQSMSPFAMAMMGLNALRSDRRSKDNIVRIGALFDGTPVYRFTYKGSDLTHIGLMAQDVELYEPMAVQEHDGVKYVDYRAATERAVKMGAV